MKYIKSKSPPCDNQPSVCKSYYLKLHKTFLPINELLTYEKKVEFLFHKTVFLTLIFGFEQSFKRGHMSSAGTCLLDASVDTYTSET